MKKGLFRRSASAIIAAAVAFTGLYGTQLTGAFDINADVEDIVISQPESDGAGPVEVLVPDEGKDYKKLSSPMVIEAGETVILDLNNIKLTRGSSGSASATGNVITVKGNLTITNLSETPTDNAMVTQGKNTGNGGAIIVEDGGTLTLEKGLILNSTAVKGGGVYVASGGKFIMNGGRIGGCSAAYGGAVYVEDGGTFEMTGGIIGTETDGLPKYQNEAAEAGGGVYVKGEFTMNGGEISSNDAVTGGGVQLGIMGSFTVKDGTIANNTATTGAGVNVGTNTSFTVGGRSDGVISITENTASGGKSNVCLASGCIINVAGSTAPGSEIGITSAVAPTDGADVQIAKNLSGGSFFTSDSTDYAVKKSGSSAYLTLAPNNFTRLQSLIDNCVVGGTVTLTTNYEYDSYDNGAIIITDGKDLIIDLNGFRIDRKAVSGAERGYVIENSGHLTIKDSSADGAGKIMGGYNSSGKGGGIYNAGELTIESGWITGNRVSGTYSSYGGGIYSTGAVTMTGGSVTGNYSSGTKAAYGGGICVDGAGSLTVSGGQIKANYASNSSAGFGGGIYADISCPVTISGGSITDNTAGTKAGGIYVGRTLTMSGNVTVKDNTNGSAKSNVYLPDTKVIALSAALSGTIGVTTEKRPTTDIVITSGYSVRNGSVLPSGVFTSDEGYYIRLIDGEAVLSLKEQYISVTDAPPTIKITRRGEEISDNKPMAGDILTAVCAASGTIDYEWYYGDNTKIPGEEEGTYAAGNTYKVKLDDAGKTIYVRALQKTDEDGQTLDTPNVADSAVTAAVTTKEKPGKPPVPTVESSLYRLTITAPLDDATHDYEYQRGKNGWTDDPVFKGLTPDTSYKLYVRVKATDDTPESDASSVIVSTLGGDHTHSEFTYKVKGNILMATCSAAGCTLPDGKAYLVLRTEGGDYNGRPYTAILDDIEEFGEIIGQQIDAVITYDGSTTAPSSAGTYNVKASLTFGNRRFTLTDSLTISRVAAEIVGYPDYPAARTGLRYDGTAKMLVTTGAVTGGTIYYRVGIDGNWTQTPTATEPGNYKVFFYVFPDDNHTGLGSANAPHGFVEVTIAGDKITDKNVSLSPTYVEYDGGDKAFRITVVIDSKTLVDGTDYTVTILDASGNTVTGVEKDNGRYILLEAKAGVYRLVVEGKAGKYAGSVTKTFTVSTKSGGMITDREGNPLTGAPIYGDTLKALVIPDAGDITYQWVRIKDGVRSDIPGATASLYVINSASDIGCSLSVKVITDGVYTLLPETEPVEKAENLNGTVPESSISITPATSDTVGDGMITISGYTSGKPVEYSTDGGKTWEAVRSGYITRLFNDMIVRIRYAGDTTHKPGEIINVPMPDAVVLIGAEISGDEIFGETLKAVPLPAKASYFTYEWYRIGSLSEESAVKIADTDEYTLVKADVGHAIMLRISDGMGREYSAQTKGTVSRRTLPKPSVRGWLSGTLDNGRITGLDPEKLYEYSVDNGRNWRKLDAGTSEITGLTEGTYLVREQVDDPETTVALAAEVTLVFEVGEQDPPSGLTPINVSESGKSDGGIRGVTTDMEYRVIGSDWLPITPVSETGKADKLAGLPEGSYSVRLREVKIGEKLIKNPSPAVTVTIKVKEPQSAPTGLVVVGASGSGKNDGAVLNVTDAMEYSLDDGKTWTAVASGVTEITGLSAGDRVLVRMRESDTKLTGEEKDLGTIGYTDRIYEAHYVIHYDGSQLTDTISTRSAISKEYYGISANAAFFTSAAESLGLASGKNKPRIVSYTVICRALYSDGTQVMYDGTDTPVPDMTETIDAIQFVDNKSGIAYSGIPVIYNDVSVYANIGAYATDDDSNGVLLSASESVGYTGLPHRVSDDPASFKDSANKSASFDLAVSLIDKKGAIDGEGGYVLIPGTDYTVSYKNNINASVRITSSGSYEPLYTNDTKRPQIIIQGKDNYKDLYAVVYFDILPIHLMQSSEYVGCFADAVSGGAVLGNNGGITLTFRPERYEREYDKASQSYMTDTTSFVKYNVGKDVTAKLQMWNNSKSVWTDTGDLTDSTAAKATLKKVNAVGQYRVLLTGIGNFCGTAADEFIVESSGYQLFSELKLKTSSAVYSSSGVGGDALVKGILARIGGKTVAASDYTITLEPVSGAAQVSADGGRALSAGTYTAYVYPKNEASFIKTYPGVVLDGPAIATVRVRGSSLTARMFSTDWSKSGEAYNGKSKNIVVSLVGISASDVTIAKPATVKGNGDYVPLSDSELSDLVEISGGRLIIKGGFLRGGSVRDSNADVGSYSIAFYGKNGYGDSVYVYTFNRAAVKLTASMLKANEAVIDPSGTVPGIWVTDPAGCKFMLYGSDDDFTVDASQAKSVGTGTVTVRVKSDKTVFLKGSSASVSFTVKKMQVSEILPYTRFIDGDRNALYIKMDNTALASKKTVRFTLYCLSYDGMSLIPLGKKDYNSSFTSSGSGSFDLTFTNGESGAFDFGRGITIKNAFVTYKKAAKFTGVRFDKNATLIADTRDGLIFTSENVGEYETGSIPVSVDPKGNAYVTFAGGCYMIPGITEIIVDGKVLKYSDGWFTVTFEKCNKVGSGRITITLSQKAAKELGIGGSKAYVISIRSQNNSGLVI